jgi:histidine triad (HIT) family protein
MRSAATWLKNIFKVKPDSCLFCKIIAGEAPGKIVYRDEMFTAFDDIHRFAPVHILIVPNRHINSLNETVDADQEWLGRMLLLAHRLAEEAGIHESGYRLMLNTGREGGQTVGHLHLHLIGGRSLIPGMS